jgi:hypothetical protein
MYRAHKTSCPLGECCSVAGMDGKYLNMDGNTGMERKRLMKRN